MYAFVRVVDDFVDMCDDPKKYLIGYRPQRSQKRRIVKKVIKKDK